MSDFDQHPDREQSASRRICPGCGKPIYEDATETERSHNPPFICSPLRCSMWRVAGRATQPHPITGARTMLTLVNDDVEDGRDA